MRAAVLPRHGGPDVFEIQDRPEPALGQGQVRVRVRAAGINFADLMARQGLYPDAPELPAVLGYEVAGEAEEIGEGVGEFAPGDRVAGWTRFGGYAEIVSAGEHDLVALPDDWSFDEGAAFPVVYGTAYAALVSFGNLRSGERLLIQAAAGGVGIAATQIGKLLGADIYGTASAGKHDAIRGFGVQHPIDYRNKDFADEVRRIAGDERPLDLIVDGIGAASWKKGYGLLRPGGRLVMTGAASFVSGEKRNLPKAAANFARVPRFNPIKMSSESLSVIGLNMLRLWDARGSLEEFTEPLLQWLDQGLLRPVVAETFPLERVADAHRYMGERKNVGKVVLTV
ncbi:MAG TPA: medium chain dehydrogenase/reductase family protein [Thermoleophilaceae bacterium]|nr:medium chain dehydrogenase/reductase family protein [Thermoleophilaceae bacterium]